MDKHRIEAAVREILLAIGENPDREGLVETPKRVAKMYEEVLEGIQYSNDELAEKYAKTFEEPATNDMVVVKHIPCFSYCEHHLALMYNMKISVGYIPSGKVIGLSKIARIADMVCRRLQLQERIGTDIAYIVKKAIGTEKVVVYIEGEHSCMTARGIKKSGSTTSSITKSGEFNDSVVLGDFLRLIGV